MKNKNSIKASPTRIEDNSNYSEKHKVAAYCRVSTKDPDQEKSYESQVKYYTEYIISNNRWQMAGIYGDKADAGAKADIRTDYQRMMNDAMAGKIDIILTKSISRFARNTRGMLDVVQKLKAIGVAIWFEEENIKTNEMIGESFLSILTMIYRQEAENTRAHRTEVLK